MTKSTPQTRSKLEGQICLILMKAGVTGPELDECIFWAFGSDAWFVPPYPDWVDRWRKLHPQFSVNSKDSFVEWIAVVGWLFVKYKEQVRAMQKKMEGKK